MTEIQVLEKNIEELTGALEAARANTYVGKTTDLYVVSGELYIQYGDNGEKNLIMCTEQLFKDLPFIITQVVKDNAKMQKMYLKEIKNALKN